MALKQWFIITVIWGLFYYLMFVTAPHMQENASIVLAFKADTPI